MVDQENDLSFKKEWNGGAFINSNKDSLLLLHYKYFVTLSDVFIMNKIWRWPLWYFTFNIDVGFDISLLKRVDAFISHFWNGGCLDISLLLHRSQVYHMPNIIIYMFRWIITVINEYAAILFLFERQIIFLANDIQVLG